MKLVIAEKHSVGENIARVLNAAQKKKVIYQRRTIHNFMVRRSFDRTCNS